MGGRSKGSLNSSIWGGWSRKTTMTVLRFVGTSRELWVSGGGLNDFCVGKMPTLLRCPLFTRSSFWACSCMDPRHGWFQMNDLRTKLRSFHHRCARYVVNRHAWQDEDEDWHHPPSAEVLGGSTFVSDRGVYSNAERNDHALCEGSTDLPGSFKELADPHRTPQFEWMWLVRD